MGKKADDLIDEAQGRAHCNGKIHELSPKGQEVLKRARQRYQEGEKISPRRLSEILTREFTKTSDKAVSNYLRKGCSCGA